MCELLVVCASEPVRLTFSLHTLAARGALPASSRDGWGVAFYQGLDVALFREPGAAGDSPLVRFLETDGPSTRMAISHIRHATQGAVQLSNTQPFARTLGGRTHVFAHNGHLAGIDKCGSLALGRHRPIGQTDSEHAFCALLGRLEPLWEAPMVPTIQARSSVLADFAAELRALGPANFVYCDADAVFVHGDKRIQQSSGRVEPPGLWLSQRHCPPVGPPPDAGGGAPISDSGRAVAWVASVPLTPEDWRPLAEGEMVVLRDGEIAGGSQPRPQ